MKFPILHSPFYIPHSTQKGFTLLELLIVVAIMAVIMVGGANFYRSFGKNVELTSASQNIQADLRQMQSKAMIADSGYKWGVHLVRNSTGNDYYTTFSTDGTNSTTTATTTLSTGVRFSDPSSGYKDIIFNKITGVVMITTAATGGMITYTDSSGLNPRSSPAYAGGYTVHTFLNNGTFGFSGGSLNVDYLVVGGGGGGGSGLSGLSGAGGGAGGFLAGTLTAMTTGAYTVTIGAGGGVGVNGGQSVFGTIIASGGGFGGAGSTWSVPGLPGGSGGSGGGGADGSGGWQAGTGGSGNTPVTTPSQGNAGSSGSSNGMYSGGGGGAGAAAVSDPGGIGRTSSIEALSVCPAGGTAPNCYYATGGSGSAGVPGGINNGGGGGGGFAGGAGGAGGSGIVVVRYLTDSFIVAVATTTAITLEGATATTTVSESGAIY